MAVNRLLANDPQKACAERLDLIFGTHDWFEAFYRTRNRNDIFGQPLQIVYRACSLGAISDFYMNRLNSIFAGVAPQPRVLVNSRHCPIFVLFFAAANEKGAPIGVRIAKHLLERI